MLFEMSTEQQLYTALVNRDPAHDGYWFVGVRTTGVFCRSTCPAKKPLQKNCHFLPTISACLEAGYRACKRCKPMRPAAEDEPLIADLMTRLENEPGRRWKESDLSDLGYDTSTVRRSFKRHYGMTFLEIARQNRIREGFVTLSNGESVVQAQLGAGFTSGSGFREAFAKLLGVAPASFKGDELLRADWIETPIGSMVAVADQHALHLLEFIDRKALPKELATLRKNTQQNIGVGIFPAIECIKLELADFFSGKSDSFATPCHLWGSDFTKTVWAALREIPVGETRSYLDIATTIGKPTATRAVARANGANQIAIVIPCHRVIGKDGSLTGYGGGLWRKQKLIELERKIHAENNGRTENE